MDLSLSPTHTKKKSGAHTRRCDASTELLRSLSSTLFFFFILKITPLETFSKFESSCWFLSLRWNVRGKHVCRATLSYAARLDNPSRFPGWTLFNLQKLGLWRSRMLFMIQSLSFTLNTAVLRRDIICVCFSQHVTFNMHEQGDCWGPRKLQLYPSWVKTRRSSFFFFCTAIMSHSHSAE